MESAKCTHQNQGHQQNRYRHHRMQHLQAFHRLQRHCVVPINNNDNNNLNHQQIDIYDQDDDYYYAKHRLPSSYPRLSGQGTLRTDTSNVRLNFVNLLIKKFLCFLGCTPCGSCGTI